MRRFLATVLLIALTAVPTSAVTLDDLFTFRVPSDLAVSPRGDRVAFTVTEADMAAGEWTSHLWLVSTKPGSTAKQITHGDGNDGSAKWSPDGRILAFLRDGQVHLLPMDGGEAEAATSVDGDLVDYEFLPDGKLVYVEREPLPASRQAEDKAADERNAATHTPEEDLRPCSIAVDGDIVLSGDPGIADVEVSPEGKTLLYASNRTGREDGDDPYDLYVIPTKGGTPAVAAPGSPRSGKSYAYDGFRGRIEPRWSGDGKRIGFIEQVDRNIPVSRTDIHVALAAGGASTNLSAQADRHVQQWTWRGNTVVYVAADHTDERFYAITPSGPQPVTKGHGYWDDPALSADGKTLAGVFEDDRHGPEVYLLNPPRKLTSLNDQVKDWTIAPQEVVTWKSDQYTIEGVLTVPPGNPPKPPLIVVPHGGPLWFASNKLRSSLRLQWFASRGYAVLQPNFRGSEGYGNAFAIANRRDLAGGDYRDIMRGVDALIAQGRVDPDRMAVMGGSYGGYMTNWIISQTDRFKAAVSMYGMFSLVTDFSNSDIPSFETDYLVDYPWENPQLYAERSPSTYVTNIHTPVLILHGDDDNNTRPANSREMYTQLHKLGRTVELITYPGEGHGISDSPAHLKDVVLRIAGWLDRYVEKTATARSPWTLRLVDAAAAEWQDPAPKGKRFLKIVLSAEAPAGRTPALDLATDAIRLEAGKSTCRPIGVPQTVLDTESLLRGPLRFTVPAREQGQSAAYPIAIAFEVPEDEEIFYLEVPGFTPIRVEVMR